MTKRAAKFQNLERGEPSDTLRMLQQIARKRENQKAPVEEIESSARQLDRRIDQVIGQIYTLATDLHIQAADIAAEIQRRIGRG